MTKNLSYLSMERIFRILENFMSFWKSFCAHRPASLKRMSYRFYAFNIKLFPCSWIENGNIVDALRLSRSLFRYICPGSICRYGTERIRSEWREKKLIKWFTAWEINWWEINILHYSIFNLHFAHKKSRRCLFGTVSCCYYLVFWRH